MSKVESLIYLHFTNSRSNRVCKDSKRLRTALHATFKFAGVSANFIVFFLDQNRKISLNQKIPFKIFSAP